MEASSSRRRNAIRIPVSNGIGLIFIPNSPRWLLARGHDDRARAVLMRLGDPKRVDGELTEIRGGLTQQKGRWAELLSPSSRPAMIVGVGLAVAQQVTGINTVIYYAPTKGRSLEQIEGQWRSGKRARDL